MNLHLARIMLGPVEEIVHQLHDSTLKHIHLIAQKKIKMTKLIEL